MKVILIAAVTADGFIAKTAEHAADWSSGADKSHFVKVTKAAGVIIMGATTFKTIGRALPGRRNIVLSRSSKSIHPEVETTSEAPKALLERLATEGHDSVCIIGGSQIYSLFMAAGLVSELMLTVEPLVFGKGISLFNAPLETQLELLNSQRLGDNSVMLHYQVIK